MSNITINKEIKNVYAYDHNIIEIYVKDAVNGRNLYSCIGCKREVNLVKRESFWHFRHYVEKNSDHPKCTYNDETHRHNLAKEILQRVKQIKVPTLYKYPSNKNEGFPKILKSTYFINAFTVRNEIYFYENNLSELKWGRKENIDDMNYLIRADSAFFDKDDNPILIIEFIATHKVTEDKKIKIKRLGIDAIQISVPKDSPQSIEESLLKNTSRTKWIYNNEEQHTEYLSIPTTFEDRVHELDSKQREFFNESFSCRKARINNLIFSIGKCLETEQFRGVVSDFESEIKRIEENTERDRNRLHQLQENIRGGVDSANKKTVNEFESRRRKFEIEKTNFRDRCSDLEERYTLKRTELEREERSVSINYRGMDEDKGGARETFEERKRTIELDNNKEEEDFRRISIEFTELSEKFEEEERRIRGQFEFFEKYEREETERFNLEETRFETEFRKQEEKITSEFDLLREQSLKQFEERDAGKDTRFSRALKKAIENGGLLDNIKEISFELSRIRKAREYIKQGTYKNWNDKR